MSRNGKYVWPKCIGACDVTHVTLRARMSIRERDAHIDRTGDCTFSSQVRFERIRFARAQPEYHRWFLYRVQVVTAGDREWQDAVHQCENCQWNPVKSSRQSDLGLL